MDAKQRKDRPVFTGVLKYFPDAIMEVAKVSLAGNQQHHPDKPLHWDRSKSNDDFDALARHLIDAGTIAFKVEQKWTDLLQLVLITVIGAYFGGRSLEKVKK